MVKSKNDLNFKRFLPIKVFTVTAIQDWNSLPVNIKKEANLKCFKNAMRRKYLDE